MLLVMPHLGEHVRVSRDVGREGVDGAAVIDHQEQQRELLLGGGVEILRHATVLRGPFSEKHDRQPEPHQGGR